MIRCERDQDKGKHSRQRISRAPEKVLKVTEKRLVHSELS